MSRKRSLGVIGLGHVGAHVAYALAVQGIRRNMQHLKELLKTVQTGGYEDEHQHVKNIASR